MVSLNIEAVGKDYGQGSAIENVSIGVKDVEFPILVGPSGCGKSTLLRMNAGFEELTDGTMHLGDRDVSHMDPRDGDAAMVFQSRALCAHITVYDNISLAPGQRKPPNSEIRRKCSRRRRSSNSNRCWVAGPAGCQAVSAIVRNPEIYPMGEPLSNHEATLRVQMRAGPKLLRQRLRATMFYITHDQHEAMFGGDVRRGPRRGVRVTFGGPVEQPAAMRRPASALPLPAPHVRARFMGSSAINFAYADLSATPQGLRASSRRPASPSI
ncbi:hypothetical protein GCM10011415_39590 [Salipiger pallidus]|uniref:ABC transporter domain-containing protein n=1 Tax=Salipiger pallidus TaxID=1775170 RepID=A0A8J2ZNW5_9RHOB|nr:hypothetical protein GCM10011415_39590 [Salipiger pallidus]